MRKNLSPQAKAGLAAAPAVAVILGATLAITLTPRNPEPAVPPASTSTTAPTTSTSTTAPSTTVALGPAVVLLPADEHDHGHQVDLVPAHDTAVAFVEGWLTPADPETRRALLAPVTAPVFLDMVAPLPPEALPPGPVESVGAVEWDGYRAFVDVHLPGLTVRVTVVETGTGWLVSNIVEAS